MEKVEPDALNVRIANANKFFPLLLALLALFSICLGPWHHTVILALVIGLPAAIVPYLLIRTQPFAFRTRLAVGAALMVFCGLNIHQSDGMIELHFGIFVLLALLLFYEDWRVLVGAAVVIASHHLLFSLMQAFDVGVMCFPATGYLQVMIHATYVVVETAALCYLAVAMDRKTRIAIASEEMVKVQLGLSTRTLAEQKVCIEAIAESSKKLAATSQAIASGAQQQAASLEETLSSIEQITATIRMNSDQAREASVLALSSGASIAQSGRVFSDAVSAMSDISQSSAKISDTIAVINAIATKTDLLAINAAVQSARAGEGGKAFGVIAAEVRLLAQRTAEASNLIKRLIQDSVAKVERGTDLVHRSREILDEMNVAVDRVGQIVRHMAEASQQQTLGIEQIGLAMGQIDQVTQSNTGETDALASTAQSIFEDTVRLLSLASA